MVSQNSNLSFVAEIKILRDYYNDAVVRLEYQEQLLSNVSNSASAGS